MPIPSEVRFKTTWIQFLAFTLGGLLMLVFFIVGAAMGVPEGLPFMGFPLLVVGLIIHSSIRKTLVKFHDIQLGSQEEILLVERGIKLTHDRPHFNTKSQYQNNVVFTNRRVFLLGLNTIHAIFDFCSFGEDDIRLVSLTQAVHPHDIVLEPTSVVLRPLPPESGIEIRLFVRDLDKARELLEIWKQNFRE